MGLREHFEEQIVEDLKLLKKLESRLRTEIDPRLELRLTEDINTVKKRIRQHENELKSLSIPPIQPELVSSEMNDKHNQKSSAQVSPAERGIALAMAIAVLITFIYLVLNPRSMESGTLAIVRFLAAVFAGISGYMFTGTLGLEAKIPLNKTQVKATGAFAVFIFVLLLFFYGLPDPNNVDKQSDQIQKELLASANVIVAGFDQKASKSVEIGRRIESALKKKLKEAKLDGISIEFTPQIIKSEIEAQQISGSNTSAIIWGWYDEYEIRIRVFLPARYKVEEFNEIPFELGRDPSSQIRLVIREDLPDNVSFLTFLIIGQLNYIDNNYAEGYKSYDIAMSNIPENVQVENQELIHFLGARQIQTSGNLPNRGDLRDRDNGELVDNLVTTVCGYTDAIEIKPSFAEAYNNLAIVLAEYENSESRDVDSVLEIKEVANCLKKLYVKPGTVGVINQMLEKALEFRPGWSLPKYNKQVIQYNTYFYNGSFSPDYLKDLRRNLKEVLRNDASLFGAYVMLASIEVHLQNITSAIEYLSKAINISQSLSSLSSIVISKLHINLGQAYLKSKQYEKAKVEFRSAVDIDPKNSEALLALAHISVLDKESELALERIALISKIESEGLKNSESALYAAKILESFVYFNNRKYQLAISTLKKLNLDHISLPNYIIALLYKLEKEANLSSIYLDAAKSGYGGSAYWDGYNHKENDTTLLVWADLWSKCFSPSSEQTIFFENCNSNNIDKDIAHVYNIFLDRLKDRTYFRGGLFIIGG